ncbi:hypothetical protein ACTHQF_00185 [Pedobacter sp. SAFR-022]|uniref:hypothetical protein n=1 Tax=Pedobacter sp. SAFR-022 TaxID=3436861 RepID=UPI003F7D2D0F
MAENFTKFLLVLAENPQALAKYQAEPEKSAKEAGLSAAERAILQSNDAALVRDAVINDTSLGASADSADGITVVVLTWTRGSLDKVLTTRRDFSALSNRLTGGGSLGRG